MSVTVSARAVQCGRVRWFVLEAGAGPGVLLVHGAGASADSFRALLPLLATRFRVVAVDLPGHARTTTPPDFSPDLPTIAAALSELVAQLGLEPRLVIGHSAGAAVLARMLLDGMVPPAPFLALAPALEPLPGVAGVLAAHAAKALSASRVAAPLLTLAADRRVIERLLASTGSATGAVEHYTRLARDPTHVAGVLAMLARWDLGGLREELAALPAPFVLVAGGEDGAIPLPNLEALARRLPRARLVVLPEAGHLIHEHMPQRVADLAFGVTVCDDTMDCLSNLTHAAAT